MESLCGQITIPDESSYKSSNKGVLYPYLMTLIYPVFGNNHVKIAGYDNDYSIFGL
jgi:hypothetical protein